MTKVCTKCGIAKPPEDFHRDKTGKNGRSARCKVCAIAHTIEWQKQHKDQVNAKNLAWKRENREKVRASSAAYQAENMDAIRVRLAAYRESHRDQLRIAGRAYMKARQLSDPDGLRRNCRASYRRHLISRRNRAKAYAKEYPERAREAVRKRRARKRGANHLETFSRREIWLRDDGICHLCKKPCNPSDWHLEHIVPLSRGGDHTRLNCAVSHPACNLSKGNKVSGVMYVQAD